MRRLPAFIATLCLLGVAVAQASAQSDTRLQANKAASRSDARALVASLRLPSGATRLPVPHPTLGAVAIRTHASTLHAKWTSDASQRAVIAYIRSHAPAGAKFDGSGASNGPGIVGMESMLEYAWPSVGVQLYDRTLSIWVAALAHGRSEVSATSESYWMVPRPLSEQVPSGVHEVEVTLRIGGGSEGLQHPHTTTHVLTADTVATIVGDLDSLPIVQPGVFFSCPAMIGEPGAPLLTLTFRAGRARPALARATIGVSPGKHGYSGWNACDPIEFWLGSTQQTALTSQTFVKQIATLIGANIS